MVGCINCNFRTGSAFSTNLKMHLKAHHKDDYERVGSALFFYPPPCTRKISAGGSSLFKTVTKL